jgi:hypothetical protein
MLADIRCCPHHSSCGGRLVNNAASGDAGCVGIDTDDNLEAFLDLLAMAYK